MADTPEVAASVRPAVYADADEEVAVERRAALYITGMQARDVADAREFLDACGLLPTTPVREPELKGIEHGMPGYRLGCTCDVCVAANKARAQAYRDRKKATA